MTINILTYEIDRMKDVTEPLVSAWYGFFYHLILQTSVRAFLRYHHRLPVSADPAHLLTIQETYQPA